MVVAGLPFKIGGQVNFTEKATFDATLGEGKRIITQLLGKSFLNKKNSLPNGFEEEQGDSASGADDEIGRYQDSNHIRPCRPLKVFGFYSR